MGKIAVTTLVFVAGLLLTGCHKEAPPSKGPASTSSSTNKLTARDLGTITLTNHYETCVRLAPDKDCLVTPVLIDPKNVQITFALESKKPNGKLKDLSLTQVLAKPGKPFEVILGGFSFSMTPNIVSASE